MMSPDWNHIRAFLATAETGSLTAAARKLGLTQPTLSRQVAALEEELGVLLFERLGRSLALTEAGRELLAHSRRMGEAADGLALAATGQAQTIEGLVRITASDGISAHILPGVLDRLRQQAPRLRIEIVAADDIRDLQRREADIAVRHVRPEQPELIARKMQDTTARFYAARSYLERRGTPRSRADLSTHDFVSFGDIPQFLGYLEPLGIRLSEGNFPVGSTSGLAAWELVRQGFGIVPMLDAIARKSPDVEPLDLEDLPTLEFPLWLATHRELHTSRRIRLVFDILADYLTGLKMRF
ncbi:LysR family transcriptional regulator [Leisingera sp. ANG-S5]|uniref:LysR family transcriptional regulator n=1 Tax=Leisingera sp. ANG-S5 TaxID=1577901 RepID=UPI00057E630F|nr:LysR family transcriptional regulator [Leisingera sp. ANG-S5]KIC34013.1 LysR family transcriptional regulator [Leisingera sp. ANG-S5]